MHFSYECMERIVCGMHKKAPQIKNPRVRQHKTTSVRLQCLVSVNNGTHECNTQIFQFKRKTITGTRRALLVVGAFYSSSLISSDSKSTTELMNATWGYFLGNRSKSSLV